MIANKTVYGILRRCEAGYIRTASPNKPLSPNTGNQIGSKGSPSYLTGFAEPTIGKKICCLSIRVGVVQNIPCKSLPALFLLSQKPFSNPLRIKITTKRNVRERTQMTR